MGYLIGGPVGAFCVLVLGVVFIALAHGRKGDEERPERTGLFDGAVPSPQDESDPPALEIKWEPENDPTNYIHRYEQPGDPQKTTQTHYRVCVVNLSKSQSAVDVEVELEELIPPVMACVPCHLRLKNKKPPDVPEKFTLTPEGRQFIDVMRWGPTANTFDIWHTVLHQRTDISAQPYTMKIAAAASNAKRVWRYFEVFRDGLGWGFRVRGESPLQIIFDPQNPARRFWSMESPRDDSGQKMPADAATKYEKKPKSG